MARWVSSSRRRHADGLGLVEGDQDRRRQEAGGIGGRFLGAGAEVVIAPAAVDGFVAIEIVVLRAQQVRDLLLQRGIIRMALMHPHQRLHGVTVSPHVVDRYRVGAAQVRQVLDQPLFASVDRRLHVRSPCPHFDQAADAQRRDRRAKSVMRTRDRGKDIQVLGPLGRAPGAVLVLVLEQEADAAVDGPLDVRGRRCGDVRQFRYCLQGRFSTLVFRRAHGTRAGQHQAQAPDCLRYCSALPPASNWSRAKLAILYVHGSNLGELQDSSTASARVVSGRIRLVEQDFIAGRQPAHESPTSIPSSVPRPPCAVATCRRLASRTPRRAGRWPGLRRPRRPARSARPFYRRPPKSLYSSSRAPLRPPRRRASHRTCRRTCPC